MQNLELDCKLWHLLLVEFEMVWNAENKGKSPSNYHRDEKKWKHFFIPFYWSLRMNRSIFLAFRSFLKLFHLNKLQMQIQYFLHTHTHNCTQNTKMSSPFLFQFSFHCNFCRKKTRFITFVLHHENEINLLSKQLTREKKMLIIEKWSHSSALRAFIHSVQNQKETIKKTFSFFRRYKIE